MLRLGTRGSALALAQARIVGALIEEALGREVELVVIRSEGDDPNISLTAPPRPGAFVATLRDALVEGRVDLVVHSHKDLPTAPEAGLVIAAVPERADPRDAWISSVPLSKAPDGWRVGTSSPRRAAGLAQRRPGLDVRPIRGNVDTRLAKLAAGEVDALVLAVAGLHRLGRSAEITEMLDPQTFLPAPAQGALAIECRRGPLADLLGVLDHRASRLAVTAERAVLLGVEAACSTPLGALAVVTDESLTLSADLYDNGRQLRAGVQGAVSSTDDAEALGLAVADDLLAQR